MQRKLAKSVATATGSLAAWAIAIAATQYLFVSSAFDAGLIASFAVAVVMPACSVMWARAFFKQWIAIVLSLFLVLILSRIHLAIIVENLEILSDDQQMLNIGLTRGFYDFLFIYISPLILSLIWFCILLAHLIQNKIR